MAIVFPASPSVNDTFTEGSITYKWDGVKWIGLGITPADRLVEGSNSLEITSGNDLVWTGDSVLLGTATANTNDRLVVYDPGNVFMSIRSDVASDGNSQVLDFGVGTADRSSANLTAVIEADIHSTSGGTLKSDLVFSTNSGNSISSKLRLTSDGDLGLGTNSPTSDGGTTFEIYDATTPTLRLNDGGDYKALFQLRGNDLEIRGSSGVMEFYTGNADGASSTEKLRIDSGGRIAQGGRIPTSHGSPNLLLWGTDPTMMIASTGSTNNSSSVGIKFTVAGGSTGDYSKAGIFVQRQDSYNDLDMIFAFRSTNDSAGVEISNEKVRISSDGMLGLGTTNPTNSHGKGLHVADANAGIRLQNTVDTGWAYVEYADESNSVKYIQGYRDVTGLYSIKPGNSLALAESGLQINPDGTTKTDWFTCAHTGKSVNASDTAVLTINGYNPTFVQVYIKANFGANGALQAHFDYELITCDAQGSGGTTTIRQSLNESVGSFQISTSDFAVTKSGQNIIITYSNQNVGVNQISFFVKGLFNSVSLA